MGCLKGVCFFGGMQFQMIVVQVGWFPAGQCEYPDVLIAGGEGRGREETEQAGSPRSTS